MKKETPFLLLVLIVPLLAALSACNDKNEPYVSNLEFSISVPPGWNYEEDISDSIRYYAISPYRPNDVTSGTDSVREDLIITREYYPGSLEDYFLNAQSYLKITRDNYDSISTEEQVINGNDFIKHISTESVWLPSLADPDIDVEIELQMVRYYVIHGDYGYLIACAATPDTWDYYKNLFFSYVGTLTFKE